MVADGTKSEYKSDLPIVMHGSIMSKIYDFYLGKNLNHYILALGLYTYLYGTVRRQDNIRVWLTDSFIRKGTGIGKTMLITIKNDLVKMGLIKIYHDRKAGGAFGKRYIEVKYVWKPEAINKLFYQEQNETTEYKIARALLIENFKIYEDIESQGGFEFETEVNGSDVTLFADNFYFNDDEMLIAKAGFHGGEEDIEYTVPSLRVREVILDLAGSYKFSLKGILYTLSA